MPVNPYFQVIENQVNASIQQRSDLWPVNQQAQVGADISRGQSASNPYSLSNFRGNLKSNWGDMSGADKAAAGVGAGLGALDLGMQAYGMSKQGLNLGQAPVEQLDEYGKPAYNLGNFQNAAASAKPQGATGAEVGGMAIKGASMGANPALVAATGGLSIAAGAIIGAGASLIGGGARKRRQRREQDQALSTAAFGQQQYNQGTQQYEQDQIAQQQYRRRRDLTNRMYNLYSA